MIDTHVMVNANIAIDSFIGAMLEEGIIDEATAEKMKPYQMIVIDKDSFVDRFKRFFGFTKDSGDDVQKFTCVKIIGYRDTPKEDDDDSDEPEIEDSNDYLKRIGVLPIEGNK